jgi:hypothetical protein
MVMIFPNPTNHLLTISSMKNIDYIEILDVSGKQLIATEVNSNETSMDISILSSGIYFVKVYNEFGIKTEKLVKE